MTKTKVAILVCAIFTATLIPSGLAQDEEQEHEQLRALRRNFAEALNTKQFDPLVPLLDDEIDVITVDNQKLEGIEELRGYWDYLFAGEDAILDGMQVNAEADDLTEFITPDIGFVQGTAVSVFDFRRLGERELDARWSALVRKTNGQWKIYKLHFSGNINDNPVVRAAHAIGNMKGIGGLIIGFILGALIVGIVMNKKKREPAPQATPTAA